MSYVVSKQLLSRFVDAGVFWRRLPGGGARGGSVAHRLEDYHTSMNLVFAQGAEGRIGGSCGSGFCIEKLLDFRIPGIAKPLYFQVQSVA